MPAAQILFLPWVRQGLAARLSNADTLADTLVAAPDLSVKLGINTSDSADMAVRLRGPGEVIGIDPRQVVRTEPTAGSSDFEALDLAAIEFDNPDLPWLFTPAAADAQGRLRPWLVLVVVRKQDGVRLRAPRDEPLPVLEIGTPARPADELPDLAESWAWAHAQLSLPSSEAPSATQVGDWLAQRPELSVSRLLCSRVLAARTDYLACVVPAFEIGRLAGLNLPRTSSSRPDLAPAWMSGATAPERIDLPVYYHWEFRTGEREDFESIVDRLAPRDLSAGVGRRPMDISQPGFAFAPVPDAPAELALEGALQPVGIGREIWPNPASRPWQQTLQSILNAGAVLPTAGSGDPLVGPPIYGRWLAARHLVDLEQPPTWLDELNLDPRERVAAGLGTRVIQAQQDELMAQAWVQAGEIAQANQRLRQSQLAATIGTKLLQRHVTPLVAGNNDDLLWRFAAPAQARLMLPGATASQPPRSMLAFIATTTTPATTLSAPLRRLTRSRGAIARRSALVVRKAALAAPAQPAPVAAPTGLLFQVFARPTVMMLRIGQANALVTIDDVSLRLPAPNATLLYAGMTDLAVANAPKRPAFQIAAEPVLVLLHATGVLAAEAAPRVRRPPIGTEPPEPPEPIPPPPPPPPPPPRVDSADARAFREAARRHLARVHPAPPPLTGLVFATLTVQLLEAQRAPLQQALDPVPALQRRLHAGVQLADDSVPPLIGTLGAVPRFALPTSEALARLSQDWLLPGLDRVPPDTVALLETNARFIEAFMVGLNVEMCRELVWRDFPLAHELGTYFDRFWRAARADKPADIAPIAQWGTRRLGHNAATSSAGSAAGAPANPNASQAVLLLRSALLQRYPGTAVYAVPGVLKGTQREPSDLAGAEKSPLFRGSLQPDVSFFGFDLDAAEASANPGWYFVLQQQPTEPRFGFDEQVTFGSASHVSVRTRPSGMTLPAATPWAGHAAELAQLIRQQPVRVLIHASELLPQAGNAAPVPPQPPPQPPTSLPPPIKPGLIATTPVLIEATPVRIETTPVRIEATPVLIRKTPVRIKTKPVLIKKTRAPKTPLKPKAARKPKSAKPPKPGKKTPKLRKKTPKPGKKTPKPGKKSPKPRKKTPKLRKKTPKPRKD